MLISRSSVVALLMAPAMLAVGCSDTDGAGEAEVAPSAMDPEARLASTRDGGWINLSGTVVSTAPSSFVLDY